MAVHHSDDPIRHAIRRLPWGLDTVQRAAWNDPFGSRARARGQQYALDHAPNARSSFGFARTAARAVFNAIPSFPDDRYRNQLGDYEAGRRKTKPRQH